MTRYVHSIYDQSYVASCFIDNVCILIRIRIRMHSIYDQNYVRFMLLHVVSTNLSLHSIKIVSLILNNWWHQEIIERSKEIEHPTNSAPILPTIGDNQKTMDTLVFNEKTLWGMSYFKNDPLYLCVIGYCFLQPLFRVWAKHSNFYENHKDLCKKIMVGYNLIMTLFSFLCAVVMIHCLMNKEKGIYSVGHFDDERVGRTYSTVTYYFYLSKYIEFLDTYFLILTNRPVIWLQYLHHIGAPLAMGLVYHYQHEGAWVFVGFNGIIHTFMYYYYACSIMKWDFPLPKQLITYLQIAQFVIGCNVCYGAYYFVEEFWKVPDTRFVFYFNYAYVMMNLVMFLNFFRTTYLRKGGLRKSVSRKTQ